MNTPRRFHPAGHPHPCKTMTPFQTFIQHRGLILGSAAYHLAAEAWDAAILNAQARLTGPANAASRQELEQVFSFRPAVDHQTADLPLA